MADEQPWYRGRIGWILILLLSVVTAVVGPSMVRCASWHGGPHVKGVTIGALLVGIRSVAGIAKPGPRYAWVVYLLFLTCLPFFVPKLVSVLATCP